MQTRMPPLTLVFLICFCFLTACKSKPQARDRSDEPTAVSATVISFSDRTGRTPLFPEAKFQRLADEVLQTAIPADVTLRSAALQGLLEDDGEHRILTLSVQLDSSAPDLSFRTALKAVTASAESTDTLIQRGLGDLEAAVSDLLHLVHAPPDRLIGALFAAEPDIQIAAASVIGARRIHEAVTSLCTLLGDPREEAAEAAADALKQTADPSDVSRIIASIERKNLRSQVRAVEVIGRIGGKEAEAYLEMIALGHPIEEVRALSTSLLKTLRERPPRAGKN